MRLPWHISVYTRDTHFNPRTPRGVRRYCTRQRAGPLVISIHAPREGCDQAALRTGRAGGPFQSTHPARGATLDVYGHVTDQMKFQSTHPARGATSPPAASTTGCTISIHAPREGCDCLMCPTWTQWQDFNPRTPRGVRRVHDTVFQVQLPISIHAPREGCDYGTSTYDLAPTNFNPRTPRGVRLMMYHTSTNTETFQSTHPARGATVHLVGRLLSLLEFQSTHPARGATGAYYYGCYIQKFQSTHPARGATGSMIRFSRYSFRFQSTHPARGATRENSFFRPVSRISIHAPREGCDSKLYERAESLLGSICLFAQGEEG